METCASFRFYAWISDPLTGLRWSRILVEHTYPAGAMVRWLAPDGAIVGEAIEGEAVEILTDVLAGCTLSITPSVGDA